MSETEGDGHNFVTMCDRCEEDPYEYFRRSDR